jgi:membrane-bound lytic murein transglycosylase D
MRTRSRFCPAFDRIAPVSTALAGVWLAGCSLITTETSPQAADPAQAALLSPVGPLGAVAAGEAFEAGEGSESFTMLPSRLNGRTVWPETILPPPSDLIGRIRAGFSLPSSDDPSVMRELAWYGSHPEYIERVFGRGSRYLHHIAETLEARGMPADIALLPIVESAFDPFAYSRGRASGLWQIIPGTGDMLGLKQNWWYDGRRDVVDSTRAALDYLESLHRKFDGDWLLAIAGYNSGEGHVARAIDKARREGRPTDFWSLRQDLPSETAAYVPKLIAIRELVRRPEAFDIHLPIIANEPFFATVETEGQIDVALAAELGEISIDALYELNPGINRWATDPDGPHRLLVPVENAVAIGAALAALEASERVRWTRHRISRGETLSEIAENYQTTPNVLREINGITGNIIRAGDHLMIPHASASAGSYSQSLDARTNRQQNRERDGNRIEGPTAIRQVNYVVRRGDSLAAIASRFRVTVDSLLDWNKLSADRYLQPGQSLVLFVDVAEQST